MRTIHIEVPPGAWATRALKILRRFDPSLTFGPTLALIRSGERVLSIETDRDDACAILERLIRLTDELCDAHVPCRLAITQGPTGLPRMRPTREASRDDLLKALEFERSLVVHEVPPKARNLIDRLARARWFSAVGQRIDDPRVLQGTMEEAQKRQEPFEEAILAHQNMLTTALFTKFQTHYSRVWNPLAELLREPVACLVDRKAAEWESPLGEDLKRRLESLIGSACLEACFADLVPPSPLSNWTDWLCVGHVPYGWSGPFPDGELMVA